MSTADRPYRTPYLELGPLLIGLAFLLVSFGAPSTWERGYWLSIATATIALGIRLRMCCVYRCDDGYTVVNLLRKYHIPVSRIEGVGQQGIVGGRGLLWVNLAVSGQRKTLRVTALPGGRRNREVVAFMADVAASTERYYRRTADAPSSDLRDDAVRVAGGVGLVVWAVLGFTAVGVVVVSPLTGLLLYALVYLAMFAVWSLRRRS